MHPFMKYLKRNCNHFYDRRRVGGKTFADQLGIFVVDSETPDLVKYYK